MNQLKIFLCLTQAPHTAMQICRNNDDVKMLCPTRSGMQLMYNICKNYAEEYNIKFNGSKSRLHLFKGRQCKTCIKSLHVNGVSPPMCKFCYGSRACSFI